MFGIIHDFFFFFCQSSLFSPNNYVIVIKTLFSESYIDFLSVVILCSLIVLNFTRKNQN